jgi:hypothetical protein
MTEPATTPATPAAPAATPAPATPAVKSNPGMAFDARIALAKSMKAAPRVEEPEAPKPAATEAPAPDPEAAEAVAEEGADDQTETEATPETADGKVTGALAALEGGNLEAAVKALGGDASKIPLPTKKAFRAIARREMKARQRDQAHEKAKATALQELSVESNRLSQLQRHASSEYGPMVESKKAWDNDDFLTVGKALEKHFKTDLATITQKLASGKVGKTDPEKALAADRAKLAADIAAFEAKKKEGETAQTHAQKRETALAKFSQSFTSHPYVQTVDASGKAVPDQEAITEVFEGYVKSWNGEKYTKTAKQVADELQEALAAKAKKRGLIKDVAPATTATPPKRTRVNAPRIPEPPRLTPPKDLGTPQHLDATRDMRIALARKTTEAQRRGMR